MIPSVSTGINAFLEVRVTLVVAVSLVDDFYGAMTPAGAHVVTLGSASDGDVLTLAVARLSFVPNTTSIYSTS